MRNIAYRIFQVVLDALIAVLFIRPWIQTMFPYEGEHGVLGIIILLAIPSVSAFLQFVLASKIAKEKKQLQVLLYAIVLFSQNLLYWVLEPKWGDVKTIVAIVAIGLILDVALAMYFGKDALLATSTPKVLVQVLWDYVLAIMVWQYMRTGAIQWMPDWGIIAVALAICMTTLWLQYAGKKGIALDAIVGVICIFSATLMWFLMNRNGLLSSSRGLRFGIIVALACLVYFVYLAISEKLYKAD